MADIKKYTSAAEMQNYWVSNIAPNYFDLENVNNYRTGIFGYINEVMSTSVMDSYHAMNVTRREFYPVSAQNPQSIYKMAALQQIDLPRATPATCKAILLLNRDEVIENSTLKNGVYTCVIDNTCKILADEMPFSLLYPITIISKYSNNTWNHTIHYNKTNTNSIDTSTSSNYYITNKTISQDGKQYLLLSVNLKQMSVESITSLVTADSLVQTVTMLFSFEGNFANFEAYYIEEPDVSTPVQLKKVMQGQSYPTVPFCCYRMLNSNLIELTFPKNSYFTPSLNSEIRLDVYTSLGSEGDFESFSGSLSCTLESEMYPYNNNMTMTGVINGSCTGGLDIPTIEEYTKDVQNAYSTNNVITTSNDLQIKFDEVSKGNANKVRFRKKRADAFSRLFGAYVLLKDSSGNVVPTNTLTLTMKLEEFDTYNGTTQKAFIKPGTIFEYDESNNSSIYSGKKVSDLTLNDDLSTYDASNSRFLFTNPFLIAVTLYPNVIGYYYNAVNETRTVEYSYINDSSIVQFIGSNLKIYRNAINGENFYKFSLTISPTSEIDVTQVIVIPSEETDEDYYIRAEENGKVLSVTYTDGMVVCTIEYDSGETDEIVVSSSVTNTEDDEYEYSAGYTLNVDVYDTFVEGDILAVKKVSDLGKIRAGLSFQNILFDNGLYVPMVIEEYNEELNTYTICGYISTDDIMDSGTILIEHGIFDTTGFEDDNLSLQYDGLRTEVSVFYQNDDANYTHKYSDFSYFRKHTLTNTYADSSDNTLALIQQIDFIKSTLTFSEAGEDGENDEDNEEEYIITLKEVPLAKANWVKSTSNFNYLTNEITNIYTELKDIYFSLENNFSIDLKFYNTYGKSKFFRVGIRSSWTPLNNVNCSFKFGVYLSSVVNKASFISQFRTFVKEAIESINGTETSQSIYILNLIHDIKENFPEIGYLEYYGFDEYEYDVQKIEPIPTAEMEDELLTNYIPEFINICTYIENGENVPNIEIEFLDSVEE